MIVSFMASDRVCNMGCLEGNQKLDIMVKPEQRIEDVYKQLVENRFFPMACNGNQIQVYSIRRMAYVNPMLTFCQGEIYAGDILLVLA